MRILLIGIGNELRGDDGAGAYIVRFIEQLNLKGVECHFVTQFTPEWLESMAGTVRTVLVDVRVTEDGEDRGVVLSRLVGNAGQSTIGHSQNLAELVLLGERLYNQPLDVWICTVPAFDFTLGQSISPNCRVYSNEAVDKLVDFLNDSLR